MPRTTIDFGIDLGTTNSEIACMDKGELTVVKNLVTSNEVTPSAVKIDARGAISVGQSAYNELELDPDNTIGEFKRWMGNPEHDGFTFKKSRKRMTAAELSAEVLKVLKTSASSRFGGEEIHAAVITVPAMFLIPACEDTKAAAKLAGLDNCPLLQEPVAAAMAYGYRVESLAGNLLVFDLGGGTFDTTVLAARDSRLLVVGHDGDDKLGGKDYDWALVDLLIQRLAEEYGNLGLSRDVSMRRPMAKLKYLAEDAKKNLSLHKEVNVEVQRLGDGLDEIDTVVQISRRDFELATEHLTQRCINICRRQLKQVRLSTDDLAAVLVVGGQSQTPGVREIVASEFGRADFHLDPMTVVARGAALFAATQRMPTSARRQPSRGGVEVKLAYNPVSTELDADLGIAIQPVTTGATVTIIRSDGGWSSGAIPLPADGKIRCTVVLRDKRANRFDIQLRDATGAQIQVPDGSFTIIQGMTAAPATTSRAFRVALVENESQVLIEKGKPLPAKGFQRLLSAHEVAAGDRNSILNIYVLEGDDPLANRNIEIGKIVLRGDEIRRSLPAGEAVEITYRLDESKTLSAEAVFPSLGEVKPMERYIERSALSSEEIDLELRKEKERLAEVERAAPERVGSQIGRQIVLIEREKRAASDDPDARQKAAQQLLELKQTIDVLKRSSEWELLVADLEEYRESTNRAVQANGTADQKREFPTLLKAAADAAAEHNLPQLRQAVERLRNMYWEIAFSQDDFWKAQFAQLWEETEFVDPLKGERLKEEGARALKRGDISSLRTIVWDLYRLLPTWQQGKLDMRFSDAGLKRTRGQGS